MSNNFRFRPPVVAALSAGLLGIHYFAQQGSAAQPPKEASPGNGQVDADRQLGLAMDFSAAFEKVASQVSPSVVNITATLVSARQRDPMEELQRRFFGAPGSGGGMQTQMATGSGVIISGDGYILTNNHVVNGASSLEVRLSDESTHAAKVIGADPATDVALIKIDSSGLVPAKLGDSNGARAGQWVLAVGSPYNLEQTVTAGIISAVGRRMSGGNQRALTAYDNFIQTDASINPGNSGGPLVNLRGEVVGINTAIFSNSGGSVGVGFAIPINLARTVADTIKATGSANSGSYLGVNFPSGEQLEQLREQGHLEGVPVADVIKGSPAEKAGLQSGDIIVSVDNLATRDQLALRTVVQRISPGRTVPVQINRSGKSMLLDVTLAAMPKELAQSQNPSTATSGTNNPLGISVREISPASARSFNLPPGVKGVQIVELSQSSPVAGSDIAPGAVIVSINGKATTDIESFNLVAGSVNIQRGLNLRLFAGNEFQNYTIRNGR
ncbi:MAG: trypsin-like peptidase domain-containing protein [Phycisphaerales bacterium]